MRPLRGSTRPTGFIGPKRSVSRPRGAMTSIGRDPSKDSSLSKSWTVADSVAARAARALSRERASPPPRTQQPQPPPPPPAPPPRGGGGREQAGHDSRPRAV